MSKPTIVPDQRATNQEAFALDNAIGELVKFVEEKRQEADLKGFLFELKKHCDFYYNLIRVKQQD